MVAELPTDPGTFMAAMMLLVVVAGSLLVAMTTCIILGFYYEMRKREKEITFVERLADLPRVTVATKTGTKYHRKACQHLQTMVIAGSPGIKDVALCQDCFPERYFTWCHGTVAGFILLIGFSLGCLATLFGMMIGPGTYKFSVRDSWQALGYTVNHGQG